MSVVYKNLFSICSDRWLIVLLTYEDADENVALIIVQVLVTGVPADAAKWKTSVVDNKWVPHWNEEHEFTLKVPELALLRLEVRDYDEESKDEFEGQSCLPIHEIRDGYRCVQMYDKKGNELKEVKMLIHFQKRSLHGQPTTAPAPVTESTTPV